MAAEAPQPFRHLSPSIAPKQHFLTVDLTVKLARADTKLPVFNAYECWKLLSGSEGDDAVELRAGDNRLAGNG